MTLPFTFQGKISRLPYALWSLGLFFSQDLLAALLAGHDRTSSFDLELIVSPIRWLFTAPSVDAILLWVGLAYMVVVAWALCALAFRRASDADINQAVAFAALVPIIQLAVMLYLAVVPSREAAERPQIPETPERQIGAMPAATAPVGHATPVWLPAALAGVIAGVGLTIVAVAVGTLIFGVYGYGVFMFTPFVIGVTAGYLANSKGNIGGSQTALSVTTAIGLGGLGLILVAIEGLICIVMAAPLALGLALIGGELGRYIAMRAKNPARQTMSCVALLPLVFTAEYVRPPSTRFDTVQTIEVQAPPDAVWRSLLSTDPVEGPLALPFRLGVAHPLRAEIIGEGVGATRRGEFSTGTAIERITEWEPNRKLAFVVVRDVPAMHEMSPYEHVHAPHVVGYFRTTTTSFELISRADGTTEVVERTSHELRLDPVLYWLPMARWVVHENNAHVLSHLRRHAEKNMRAAR